MVSRRLAHTGSYNGACDGRGIRTRRLGPARQSYRRGADRSKPKAAVVVDISLHQLWNFGPRGTVVRLPGSRQSKPWLWASGALRRLLSLVSVIGSIVGARPLAQPFRTPTPFQSPTAQRGPDQSGGRVSTHRQPCVMFIHVRRVHQNVVEDVDTAFEALQHTTDHLLERRWTRS